MKSSIFIYHINVLLLCSLVLLMPFAKWYTISLRSEGLSDFVAFNQNFPLELRRLRVSSWMFWTQLGLARKRGIHTIISMIPVCPFIIHLVALSNLHCKSFSVVNAIIRACKMASKPRGGG